MDATLQELNHKIDKLTDAMTYLSEQAQYAERQRQERAELVRDITPLANQAFNIAVEQLEEVQEYIDLNDILRLLKRLLRNGRNLEKILDQLESLADLVDTISPLADEAFCKAVDLTASLEAKGYFDFARGAAHLADNLVASLTAEDLTQIGNQIGLVKHLAMGIFHPDVLKFANETMDQVKEEVKKPVDVTYTGLLHQMRDPAVRRGLALTLRIMHVIGVQAELHSEQ